MRFIVVLLVSALTLGLALAEDDRERIDLQPLGRVRKVDIETAVEGIEKMYNAEVHILRAVPLPKSAYYAPRRRHRADTLLSFLRAREHGIRCIALTSGDISTTNGKFKDWGVLGLGSMSDKVCIVSTFRMGRGKVKDVVYRSRLQNTLNHEIGHTYGLPHCDSPDCLMSDAHGRIQTVDNSWNGFCEKCRRRLGSHLRGN